MESYSISNVRILDLKVVPLSFSVISNDSGLLVQSNCYDKIPVWTTLCAVNSRGNPTKSDLLSCITFITATFYFVAVTHGFTLLDL